MSVDDEPLVFGVREEVDGVRVARSPWGPDDEIGRLNWLTDEARRALLGTVDGGVAIDLSVDFTPVVPRARAFADPSFHIRSSPLAPDDPGASPDYPIHRELVSMLVHHGTHVDSLLHAGFCDRYWNGLRPEQRLACYGGTAGGEGRFPPIFARGVLLDVPRLHGVELLPDGHAVSVEEVRAAARAQRAELRRGDVVLLRTGRGALYPDDAYVRFPLPGLSLAAARYLCEEVGAIALGADTVALESMTDGRAAPVHAYMFVTAGAAIVEILDLERLAGERLYEFAFLGFPLKLHRASGAPIRAVALSLR